MSGAGSDFIAKVQSVIWESVSLILKHQETIDMIDRHRVGAQETLAAIDTPNTPRDRIEGIERLKEKVEANERSLEIYNLAISIASGSILQIAKQAISMQHGGFTGCPSGRCISGFFVKDLILHGRNQFMHYEEGLKGKTLSFVERLENELPDRFTKREPARSHAKAILDLLGWTTELKLIASDMEALMVPSTPEASSS